MFLFDRTAAITIVAAIVLAMGATAASAASIVKVELWDQGADVAMRTDMAYGTPGLDLSQATMGITAVPESVPAGIVKFDVTNSSTDTIHEMIVIKLGTPGEPLAMMAGESRVDEDNVGDKGEVSELDPGASGSLTVPLQPGDYILICNIAGHFAAGMWTTFTVN
jgi:uncharacterized cupredoxin-like copper-binding protein